MLSCAHPANQLSLCLGWGTALFEPRVSHFKNMNLSVWQLFSVHTLDLCFSVFAMFHFYFSIPTCRVCLSFLIRADRIVHENVQTKIDRTPNWSPPISRMGIGGGAAAVTTLQWADSLFYFARGDNDQKFFFFKPSRHPALTGHLQRFSTWLGSRRKNDWISNFWHQTDISLFYFPSGTRQTHLKMMSEWNCLCCWYRSTKVEFGGMPRFHRNAQPSSFPANEKKYHPYPNLFRHAVADQPWPMLIVIGMRIRIMKQGESESL